MPVWLVLLALAVLTPLTAFSLFSLSRLAASVHQINVERIAGRPRSVSANVDREIAGIVSTAVTLGTSKMLEEAKFGTFYNQKRPWVTPRAMSCYWIFHYNSW